MRKINIKKLFLFILIIIAVIPLSRATAAPNTWFLDNAVSLANPDIEYMTFPAYSPVGNDFTIEVLTRLNDSENWGRIISVHGSPADIRIYYNHNTNTIISALVDDSGITKYPPVVSNISVSDGSWHHFAITANRTTEEAYLYIDGEKGAVLNTSTLGDITTSTLGYLGTSVVGNSVEADYAYVRYWSEARTEAEIQDNIHSVLVGNEANLERYYTFDDGTGATVTDQVIGGGNDGTLYGTPSWTRPFPVIIGEASLSGVPSALEDALEDALDTERPDQHLELMPLSYSNMWAVTSYTETDTADYYWVSLAGLAVPDTADLDGWDLSQSIWYGVAIAEDNGDTTYTAHLYGSSGYTIMVDAAGIADIGNPDTGGTGDYTDYFPWAAGYSAYFGSKGIHGAGDATGATGGTGWIAVDWVGGAVGYTADIYPNGVYVARSGVVEAVCRDNIQTWVQIGDYLYAHLVDNSTLREGVYHSQGSYLGALVTGTHLTPGTVGACLCPGGGSTCVDARCGYMCQQETSYHLHLGFKPTGNYFQVEGWTLNISTEEWTRGNEGVTPGEYMLAEWSTRPEVPTPGPTVTPGGPTVTPSVGIPIIVDGGGGGGQIWDGFIAGMKNSVQNRVNDLNEATGQTETREPQKYIQLAVSGIRIMVRSTYVLLRSNLDMRLTIAVVFLILVMEPVRVLSAVWMWIKTKIPFIG